MIDTSYFHATRRDIAALLPQSASRILDVGCGAGRTAAWLKSLYPGSIAVGLEGNPALKDDLARNLDESHIVDLNGPLPDLGAPDLVLCLDVLEHLVDPDAVLKQLVRIMPQHGMVIVSLPNIAHFSVSLPLLLRGQFEYREDGILDRTHLRFFVHRTAVAMMNRAGLVVGRGLRLGLKGPRSGLADRATLGLARDRLATQFALAGTRSNGPVVQGPIAWGVG